MAVCIDASGLGTWSIQNGTSYEAENGTRGGSSTILSGSAFSGGKAVGYLGKQCCDMRLVHDRTSSDQTVCVVL